MASNGKQSLAELIAESEAVEAAVRDAVREALLRHKQAGNPVATWKNGKVLWIPADNIDLAEFDAAGVDSRVQSEPTT